MSEKWNKKEILPIPEGWDKFDENKFNDWLFQNMEALDNILSLGLEPVEREHKNSDNKRLDILAKYFDEDEEKYIAIESQLNTADFSHFGRLLMYLATAETKPKIGVWIVGKAEDSHKKSVEWLNSNTLTKYAFWMLSVNTVMVNKKAVGIEIVPIVEPDMEKRSLYQEKQVQQAHEETETQSLYRSFWEVFGKMENELAKDKFSQSSRGLRNYGNLMVKNSITVTVNCSYNKLRIHILTRNPDIKAKLEECFHDWAPHIVGNTDNIYLFEKELFSNWQKHPDKWEEYSTALINEAVRVIDILEKL